MKHIYCNTNKFTDGVVFFRYELDGKWGLINESHEIILEPQFDDVKDFYEGFATVKKVGKWGFIDTTGKDVVEPQITGVVKPLFDDVKDFYEGFAAVKKDGKWGFIDTTGSVVIEPQFDYVEKFSEDFAIIIQNKKYTFIDKTGKVVIEQQFEYIGDFSEGLARFQKDNNQGFIDTTGSVVIEPQFYYAGDFHEGFAAVKKDGKWGFIDTTGSVVIEPQFDYVEKFSEGFAGVCVSKGGKYGFIDTTGKIVIEANFDDVGDFYQGFAAVRKGKRWGFINKIGKIIIQPQFIRANLNHAGFVYIGKNNYIRILTKRNENRGINDKYLEMLTESNLDFKITINNIPKELFDDKEFILEAVKDNWSVLEFVSERLKNDKEVVLRAVSKYTYFSIGLEKDENADMLKFVSKELCDDYDIVQAAIRINFKNIIYASDRLQEHEGIILLLVDKVIRDYDAVNYLPQKVINSNLDLAKASVMVNGINGYFALKNEFKDQDEILDYLVTLHQFDPNGKFKYNKKIKNESSLFKKLQQKSDEIKEKYLNKLKEETKRVNENLEKKNEEWKLKTFNQKVFHIFQNITGFLKLLFLISLVSGILSVVIVYLSFANKTELQVSFELKLYMAIILSIVMWIYAFYRVLILKDYDGNYYWENDVHSPYTFYYFFNQTGIILIQIVFGYMFTYVVSLLLVGFFSIFDLFDTHTLDITLDILHTIIWIGLLLLLCSMFSGEYYLGESTSHSKSSSNQGLGFNDSRLKAGGKCSTCGSYSEKLIDVDYGVFRVCPSCYDEGDELHDYRDRPYIKSIS